MGSKTSVSTPAPSEQEKALTAKQIELAEFQLDELRRQREQQEQFAEDLMPLFEEQAKAAEAARLRQEELAPLQEELLNLTLEDLRRGGAASPEQIALIDEATEAGIAAGNVDIERFETDALERLREELAPSLGLRPGDSPILDRGARVAAEATRQRGQLSSGLRGAAAQARLNFPLAQSALLQQSALGQQSLLESTRQFQDQLRSQAVSNRLNLASTLGGLGLNLAGNPAGTLSSAINPLVQGRLANQTSRERPGALGYLQAAGTAAAGIGAVLALSSREAKTDKAAVSEERILEAVERLPVETWRYAKGLGLGDDRHVGTYAEDFRETFGIGDGVTLNLADAVGVVTASVKALGRKMKRLEAQGFGLATA